MEKNNIEEIIKDYYSIKEYLIEKNNESDNLLDIESFDLNNNDMTVYHNMNNLKNTKNYLLEENLKLKICLNNIKEKYNKEISIKLNNINKQKQQLKADLINLNKNKQLIEELKNEIENYENIKKVKNNERKNEIIEINKENEELKNEVKSNEIIIDNLKKEINEKKEIFNEINKIKNEMNDTIEKIDNLNNEIEEKNIIIKELEDNNIKQIRNNLKNKEKEILLKELKESKEKQQKMKKELEDIKIQFININNQKEKLNELSQTTNQLLKSELNIKDKLKDEYEKKIQNLINEYEQNNKTIEINKKDNLNEISKINGKINIEAQEKNQLENDILNMNDYEKKYSDLLNKFSQLKEENISLKNNISSLNLKNNFKINKKINRLISNDIINYENLNNKESIQISDKKDDIIKLNKQISFDDSLQKRKLINSLNLLQLNEDLPNLVYNKKKPKKISLNSSREKSKNKNTSFNKKTSKININEKEIKYSSIINEDNLEGEPSTNESFYLYKPIKEGLLSFNLTKKNYNLVIPENYSSFWNNFEPQGSLQYNTLEGLFIVNSKDYQLYYYSSKKNSFCELFCFNYDHKEGCLFLDNLSKNIIAIGGLNTTAVEKFSFESGTMNELPNLSTHRYKMTCCQVNNKIYCFFGKSIERKNESLIEYLDLEKINLGWIEIIYENKTSFKLLTYMSCVNLNDCELLIIGGLIEDKTPNQKLLYFNSQKSEFIELNKNLPDSDVKRYLFSKNIMFNLFLKNNIISFTNIDDNNQVHILDNDLKYDLYLAPKFN